MLNTLNLEIMEDSVNPKEKAKELGIDPEELDFTLNEKELETISGGSGSQCGEIGLAGSDCTKTGYGSACTEIGVYNDKCTKVGS